LPTWKPIDGWSRPQMLLNSDPATVEAHLARWLGTREDFLKA
jgi:hypothetical protein